VKQLKPLAPVSTNIIRVECVKFFNDFFEILKSFSIVNEYSVNFKYIVYDKLYGVYM